MYPGNQVFKPFLRKNGAMIDLGTVSGDPCGIAFGINSAGRVVGSSGDCKGNGLHAFLWENGDIVDLNSLIAPASGLQLKSATNINDRGEIAGTGVLVNGDQHTFVLIPCGGKDSSDQACEGEATPGAAIQNNPATTTKVPNVALEVSLTSREIAARVHGRFARKPLIGVGPRK